MLKNTIKADKKSLAVILFTFLLYLTGLIAVDPVTLGIEGSAGFPIVLQNMTAVSAGILLGGAQGTASVGLYILLSVLLGFFGIPVFTPGFTEAQGLDRLTGQSGGYILGYFFAAAAAGFIMGPPASEKPSIKKLIKASSVSYALIYVLGISQFLSLKGFTLSLQNIRLVFTVLIAPYLPFDAAKLILTVFTGFLFRPIIARKFF